MMGARTKRETSMTKGLLILWLLCTSVAWAQPYTVTDLGQFRPVAINDDGVIADTSTACRRCGSMACWNFSHLTAIPLRGCRM